MKDMIQEAIRELFESAPDSQEAQELQEEMISNAEERYEDLVQRGFTEEQAYTMVMGSIGDIQELLVELGAQSEAEDDEKSFEDAKNDYWEKQKYYWDKQCEYWKWQGENLEKHAKNLESQAKNFGQQFEQQAKEAMNTFMASDILDNISSSIKQIIGDFGIKFQSDDGNYSDTQLCNERKFSPDGIFELVMELQGSPVDVDVQLTTDPEILIQEFYNKVPQDNQFLEYTVSGKQLRLQYGPNLIGFPRRGIVRVFLPEASAGALEELKIVTASGDVSLEDLGAAKQTIKTISGDISGACSIGDVILGTVSGDVAFEAIEGEAQIKTVSGDINVSKIVGKANINTASGDIQIKEFQGEGNLRSASGDVECNVTKAGEKMDVDTASGDVLLTLPEDASLQMTLNTASGDIRTFCDSLSAEENVNYVKSGKRAVGTIGEEPFLKLKVSTASGDIEINR